MLKGVKKTAKQCIEASNPQIIRFYFLQATGFGFGVRIRNGGAVRFVSMDEGKTWVRAEPSDHAAVFIWWQKVQE
jgi:hypothetical protein